MLIRHRTFPCFVRYFVPFGEIEDNTPCVVTLDAFITDGGDGYDASLFKGYEIPEFDKLGIISTDAFMDYLKGIKKPITVESTHMPVISK